MKVINVFFGAGKIGKQMVCLWKEYGMMVDYFIDNNSDIWGIKVEGIPVININELLSMKAYRVFLTCKMHQEVREQLIGCGVNDNDIYVGNTLISMMKNLLSNYPGCMKYDYVNWNSSAKRNIFFDLQNGLVLGGVESWVFQETEYLKKIDCNISYLTSDLHEALVEPEGATIYKFKHFDEASTKKRIEKCLEVILHSLPCNIVCNFVGYNFIAACIAKKMFPDSVNVITVVHNDEEAYYNSYSCMQEYIDYCLTISSQIKKKLLLSGFREEKIHTLNWRLNVPLKINRKPLRKEIILGYAGRIVILQKRIDLLFEVAMKLKELGIEFRLDVAGVGEYLSTLEEKIEQAGLKEYVHLRGYIEHDKIFEFWEDKDIMISCSDYEGRSISKAEAMASGAVPVVTDTSGASDDIQNGYNGYIVETNNAKALVEKIVYLYEHRELLFEMGQRAHESICKTCSSEKGDALWSEILK